jgi:hypothetical protein
LPETASARSTLGGIVFLDFYLHSLDQEASGLDESSSFARVELPNISRLRGLWTNEDNIEMFLEVGLGGSSGSTGVNLRHAFGKWDFSTTGQLLAGHSTTPFSPLFPTQAIGNNAQESFNVGKGYGEVDSGRAPQVRYTYKFLSSRGALAIALLDPNRDDEITRELEGVKAGFLPRIDIGLAYGSLNWQLFPGIFYQQKKLDGVVGVTDDSITSWGASLGWRGGRGPFVLAAEGNFGQNLRNANFALGESAAAVGGGAFTFSTESGEVRLGDTENLSFWVDAGYKFTHDEIQGTVHLVVGQMTSERQDGPRAKLESRMVGISVPIDLPWFAKGFRVRPEVFVYENDNADRDDITANDGTQVLGGVQFQYTF